MKEFKPSDNTYNSSQPSDARKEAERLSVTTNSDTSKTASAKSDIAEKSKAAAAGGLLPDLQIGGSPETQWTLAVDLRADRSVAGGNAMKMAALQSLAEKTRGSSVKIIAQIVTEEPGKGHGSKDLDTLTRYTIANGKVTLDETKPDEGYATDVKDLIKYAASTSPAGKLGFVEGSHGGGSGGLSGFGGKVSLDDFTGAIKDGLAGSGRSKLDMVDLDACIMGSVKVLDKMKSVTDNLVASEVPEADELENKSFSGQNMKAVLSTLISKPEMDGRQFASAIVDDAELGFNNSSVKSPTGMTSGTDTLASFDLTKLNPFEQKLNEYGQALSAGLKDDKSRSSFQSILNGRAELDESIPKEMDIKMLVGSVDEKIKSGDINDGGIRDAGRALLQAQAGLETNLYVNPNDRNGDLPYSKLGGLSTFLPPSAFSSVSNQEGQVGAKFTGGAMRLPDSDIQIAVSSLRDAPDSSTTYKTLADQLDLMKASVDGKYPGAIDGIISDVRKMQTQNSGDKSKTATAVYGELAALPADVWKENENKLAQSNRNTRLERERLGGAPEWSKFAGSYLQTSQTENYQM